MGLGTFLEPLVVVTLLVGGTLVNRERRGAEHGRRKRNDNDKCDQDTLTPSLDHFDLETLPGYNGEEGLHDHRDCPHAAQERAWRKRSIGIRHWRTEIKTPDTQQFSNRPLSRLLRAYPFLVEVWYWALIYWVYQLARAFTAVTLSQGTVDIARTHALQLTVLERRLHIFWEPAIQAHFLKHPTLMLWINRIYSFVHIPGTILFLIWLYYLTVTANRTESRERSPAGPALYQRRRRTMAMCNLIAFVVFTAWPCMPPRLLGDTKHSGQHGALKGFGFVDTVHGAGGESSVWTQNKFCNQYAAMPSLHFGYSLLIGLTIASIPLASSQEQSRKLRFCKSRVEIPSRRRLLCLLFGIAYPTIIFIAIVATANHFILDAVAGAFVCYIAWNAEGQMLNLLPLEDWFLWCLRLHKPEPEVDLATALQRSEKETSRKDVLDLPQIHVSHV